MFNQILDWVETLAGPLNNPSEDQLYSQLTSSASRFINVDGMDIHYRDQGQGPTLILLHGMLSSLHTWEPWVKLLKKQFRIISLDLPNFGLSDPTPNYRINDDTYQNLLDQFINALELTDFILVGNSFGGYVACQYAGNHPDKVNKLVLMDAAGFHPPEQLALMSIGGQFSGLMMEFSPIPRWMVATTTKDLFGEPQKVTDEIIDRYHMLVQRDHNRKGLSALLRYFSNNMGFKTNQLHKILCPVLIQWGEKDSWVPVDSAYKFQQAIRNSKLCIYPDAGHIPMEECPRKTAMDLLAFAKD